VSKFGEDKPLENTPTLIFCDGNAGVYEFNLIQVQTQQSVYLFCYPNTILLGQMDSLDCGIVWDELGVLELSRLWFFNRLSFSSGNS